MLLIVVFLFLSVVPTFIKVPQSALVDVGTTIAFDCVADGHPKPLIMWERSGASLKWPMQVLSNGSLLVRNARVEDAGEYACLAESDQGKIMAVFTLIVKGKLYTGRVRIIDIGLG